MADHDMAQHSYHVQCSWGSVYVYAVSTADAIGSARAAWGKTYRRLVGRVRPEQIPVDVHGYAMGVGQVTEARQRWNRAQNEKWLAEGQEG